ncbi:T9SS type B sorting domain-containing protein [Flaviramulus basaltis]|nr:gliding motility-associated C-terminal domain-containing protein [Flaviramulus basaltis]
MKTKKTLILTIILIIFTVAITVAQNVRGGCTNSNAYYNAGAGWNDDTDVTSNNETIVAVSGLANFTCGISNPRQNVEGSTFTIDVFLNGSEVASQHDDQTTFTGNDYTVANPIPLEGDTCQVVITVTPVAGTLGCAGTEWTYTWNLSAAVGCIPSTPVFYYNTGTGGWHDPTTPVDNAITVDPLAIGGTIEVGAHLNGGSISWSDGLGFTSTNNQVVYDPGFTAGEQTRTLTAAYTDACGDLTNYVYNLSSTSACSAAIPIPYYNNNNAGTVNKLTTDTTIDIEMVIGKTIVLGIRPNTGTVAWTGCNGFTESTREFTFDPGFTAKGDSCSITGVYTDTCGNSTSYTYNLSVPLVCTPATPTLYYNDNNGSGWIDPAAVDAGNIITIDPIPYSGTIGAGFHLNGGTVAWSDGLGFTSTANQVNYNPNFTGGDETRILTASYTDTCGDVVDYFYNISSTSECISSVPVFYYNDGSGWVDPAAINETDNSITPDPIQFTDTIEIGVRLNGGSIVWTDDQGTGFTSTAGQFGYDPGFTAVGQNRVLTGAYTNTCDVTTNYVFNISASTECIPQTLEPYYNDNVGSGTVYHATTDYDINVGLQTGGSIWVGINPAINEDAGETLVWTGCNGFSGTEKEFTFYPEFDTIGQTCDLVGTFTDACGTIRSYTYHLTAETGCLSPDDSNPYYNIGNGWENALTTDFDVYLEVPPFGLIYFGIDPGTGGNTTDDNFVWNDSLGYVVNVNGQQLALDGVFENSDDVEVLTCVYTDKCGVSTTYTFNLTVICSPPVFTYNDNNGSDLVDPATVEIDNTISIDPIPYSGTVLVGINNLNGGTVTWSDGLGFTSTLDGFTYNPGFTGGDQTRTLTATYTDFCGTTIDYSYNISSTSECIPSVPTFYYNTGGDNSPEVNLDDSPITIVPIQVGETVIIGVNLNGGTISWSDDNATTPFTGTDSEFTYNPGFTAGNQTRTLTGLFTGACGNTASFVYNLNALDECAPNAPTAPSPQIVCKYDIVATLDATVDAGTTLLWYTDETGGSPLDPFTTLVPGNYYAAAVTADGICESPRILVVVATNNALYFDGLRNSYVSLKNSPILDKATEFTIEAWIKPDDSNWDDGYHAIFGAVQTGGNNQRSPSFYLYNGQVHTDSYEDVTLNRYDILTEDAVIFKNVWSHIALVKLLDSESSTGSTYNVYVNGKLVATRTAPLKVNVADDSEYTFGVVDNFYSGLIDEARFWNVPRSASEVADNMEIDLTGNEPGLVDYYTFNQGIGNGDNTAITTLYDNTSSQNNGTIIDFYLTGNVSNFVGGYFAQITGSSSTTIIGGTIQLAHTTPDGYWSSDAEDIVTVDSVTGLATGVSLGTAVISYEFCGVSTTYPITVVPNSGPTISQIEDQETCPGTDILDLPFIIEDDATPVNSLVLTATSSNTDLIPNDQIVLGGTDENRTVTLSPVSGESGTAIITITATDSDDMFSTMSFTVTFTDTTKPIAITQDIEVELDANGEVTITGAQINNGSTDDCTDVANLTLAASPSSFTCANIGINTVTLTVTDASGNFETNTATVTIFDVTGPMVITQDISIELDAADEATITADQINNGSNDSCTNASDLILSVSPSSFTCANIGENTVTLTVIDTYGNENTETAIVTVTESNAPTVITQTLTVTIDDSGYVSITADQLDNGSSDSCGDVTFTASQLDFSCSDIGDNTVTLTVEDESGNTSSGSTIVTVIGNVYGCGIKVSEAITANGDGINDTWIIYNIEDHPNTSVRVFNRWGAEVYFSRDYKNDWNGHYYRGSKNQLPSSGSYYYQVDVDGDGTLDNQGWLYITK